MKKKTKPKWTLVAIGEGVISEDGIVNPNPLELKDKEGKVLVVIKQEK